MYIDSSTFYSIICYTISALFSIGVNVVFYLKARQSALLSMYLKMNFLMIIWLFAKILRLIAPNQDVIWLWIVVQYMAVCFFGVTFLDFTHLYRYRKTIDKRIRIVLYGIATVNYLVLFTNNLHHLFYKSIMISLNIFGPWFYVHAVYSYILIIIAYILLVNSLFENDANKFIVHKIIFRLALSLPIVANFLYISKLINFSFDITPIMFNITIIIFGYAAYQYHFLDIKKVSRSMILENINEGIIIIDTNRQIIEQNSIIEALMIHEVPITRFDSIDVFFNELSDKIEDSDILRKKINDCLKYEEDKFVTEFVIIWHGQRQTYFLKVDKIKDKSKRLIGYAFRLINVSKYKELHDILEEKNEALNKMNKALGENISATKQLAIAKERSRISKELHDILGHSLIVTISILEMSRGIYKTDRQLATKKVTEGMEIIRGGLVDLKRSMKLHSSDYIVADKLKEDLVKLISDFEKSGVKVEFYYKELDVKLSSEVYDTVYRVCQEGLTNALRHGKIDKVIIGLRHVEQNIDLVIIDNGAGCKKIIKGNGLLGMETRIKALAGCFSYGSPDGKGFNIHAILPISDG